MKDIQLIHGDCIEEMAKLPDNSIDLCLTDPPYGKTPQDWDRIVDSILMWRELKRIVKPNGAICLFGMEPFSSMLRTSNLKMYKYDWVWDKVNKFTGFLNAKRMPMTDHELISVFYRKQPTYNRQFREGSYTTRNSKGGSKGVYNDGHLEDIGRKVDGLNPKRILHFPSHSTKKLLHKNQKPVALLEYFIKTYTDENEMILDFTAGSYSTAEAARNLNRKAICIEDERKFYDIGVGRLAPSSN